MANITFQLRSSGENSTIYFLCRPSRDLYIRSATPYKINSEKWDSKNQCWNKSEITKSAKTTESKNRNAEIENFNRDLLKFKINIESFLNSNLEVEGAQLKSLLKDFVQRNYFAHKIVKKEERKEKFPEAFSDLVDYYLNFRSVEDVTKGTKPLAQNTIKKYNTLKKVVSAFSKKRGKNDK